MANNAYTIRLVFLGTISGVQSFSTGVWFSYKPVGTDIPPSQSDVAAALAASSTFEGFVDSLWGVLSGYMAANTTMVHWQVSVYGAGGLGPAEAYAGTPTSYTGSSSYTLPAECALVASLRTGNTSKSGRGRMYLPLTGMHIGNDGLAPTAAATDVATAVAAFLTSVDGATFTPIGGGSEFTLRSIVNSTTHSETNNILRVIVDTKVDVIRAREDKLASTMVIRPVS